MRPKASSGALELFERLDEWTDSYSVVAEPDGGGGPVEVFMKEYPDRRTAEDALARVIAARPSRSDAVPESG